MILTGLVQVCQSNFKGCKMTYKYRVELNTEMECYVLKVLDDEIPLMAADFDEAIEEAQEIVQEWA